MFALSLIYVQGCKCRNGVNIYGNVSKWGDPTIIFVLYTCVPLMCNACAMQVIHLESTDNTEDTRKYKTFFKNKF